MKWSIKMSSAYFLILFSVLYSVVCCSADSPLLNTQDVAILLPAKNKSDVEKLLKLSAKPFNFGFDDANIPRSRFNNAEILSQATFNELISNSLAIKLTEQEQLSKIPKYDKWRIIAARIIPCARPSNTVNGHSQNVDLLDPTFTISEIMTNCQLEHRLVAQPFDEHGIVKPFAIHIINRPFALTSSENHTLSRLMLADLLDIKTTFKITNTSLLGVYPKSDNPLILERLNKHIVRYYGGGLLTNLSVMSSNEKQSKFVFWFGAGRNPEPGIEAKFAYSNDIRPTQIDGMFENDVVQIIDVIANDFSVRTLDVDLHQLHPSPGLHSPSIYRFMADQSNVGAQLDLRKTLNSRKYFISNLDCASCHGVTDLVNNFDALLAGEEFDVGDSGITIKLDPKVQSLRPNRQFINLGYVAGHPSILGNQPLIGLPTVNDAALTAAFINRHHEFWLN